MLTESPTWCGIYATALLEHGFFSDVVRAILFLFATLSAAKDYAVSALIQRLIILSKTGVS